MSDLSAFPITKRWPAKRPDVLQLYSLPTPNGVKVSIALEELGLPYEPHLVDIGMFGSGAILLYLSDKTGKLVPAEAAARYETIQWLFFQMAFIGPMFGQVGYFYKFAGKEIEDKRPLNRYRDEAKRLLGVLDRRLEGRQWVMGDLYTIADISM